MSGTTITVTIDAVRYRSDNGWGVYGVAYTPTGGAQAQLIPPEPETSTAVGELLVEPYPGQVLRLTGYWGEHPKYGKQFKFYHAEAAGPQKLAGDGLVSYLASSIFPGIGPALAQRIVDTFGETAEDALNDPEKLVTVRGITRAKAELVCEQWRARTRERGAMTYLMALGVTAGIARRIFDTYGTDAEALITQNPYRLAWDVDGVGFQRADAIAQAMGFDPTSDYRIEAGLLHALKEARMGGHSYLPRETLVYGEGSGLQKVAGALELLGLDGRQAGLVDAAITRLARRGGGDAVVVEGERVYLPGLWNAETAAANILGRHLASTWSLAEAILAGKDIDAEIRAAAEIELNEEQRQAVCCALTQRVSIVTGGPGTGKTTCLRTLLNVIYNNWIDDDGKHKTQGNIILCAPTGRAAKRMAESTGTQAMTIHRLLGYQPGIGFGSEDNEPLDAFIVVVDEASMLDISLFHVLLVVLPLNCHLVLVGDADQLPSVGPGNVLRDLVGSGCAPVTRLQHIYRQDTRSAIVENAHAINAGVYPKRMNGEASDFFFSQREEASDAAYEVVSLVSARLIAQFQDLHLAHDDIMVLAPQRSGAVGVTALNTMLQDALNLHGEPVKGTRLRIGDRVMQLKNDYERGVFNGDTGRIIGVDAQKDMVYVEIDGRQIVYKREDLDELTLAYASTIHKAQGSEAPCVVVVCHSAHTFMLQRNLVYTAVTRARKLVVIVGTRKALWMAVQRNDQLHRYSMLAERVRGATRQNDNI